MTDLKNEFIKVFEPTMKIHGFMRKGKVFHRIVNGKIVQLLSYYKFEGPEFTVQFAIQPLCTGEEYSVFMDDSRMCEEFKDVPEWEYEYNTDGFKKLMPEALRATEEKLVPLFDSMVGYETYLEKRKILTPQLFFSDTVYMINMVLGNYETSKKSREKLISNSIEANQRRWGTDSHNNPYMQSIFEQECEEYYIVKRAMDNNDREYIERYIYDHEQKSLKSYIKAFTTPKKYQSFLNTGVLPFDFVTIR